MKKTLTTCLLLGALSLPLSGYADNMPSMSCVGYTADQENYALVLITAVDPDSKLGQKGITGIVKLSIGRTVEHSKPVFSKTYKIIFDSEDEAGVDVKDPKNLRIIEDENQNATLLISGRDISRVLGITQPLQIVCEKPSQE